MAKPYNISDLHRKKNNKGINKVRKDKIEKYILEINQKLSELADFLFIDIKSELNNITIQKIKESQIKNSFIDASKESAIRKAAIEAAGITSQELSVKTEYLEIKAKGNPPPKTDWKRESLDKGEKDKILNSLRANPNSNIFSKEFKWDIKEFLKPFSYLESSENYNGPFIVSVIDDKNELEKYSKINNLNRVIHDIYFGKYVLASMYDITASNENFEESKHIYIGLKFIGFSGRLEFDRIGSISNKISNEQKLSIKDYLDSMDILYDENSKYLKANL